MIILIRYEPCIASQCSGVLFGLSDASVWSKFPVSENLQSIVHSIKAHVVMHDKPNCKPLIAAAVRRFYIVLTHVTLRQHGSVTKLIHYCLGTVTTAIKFLLFPLSQTQHCTCTVFSNLSSHPLRHTRTFWHRQG